MNEALNRNLFLVKKHVGMSRAANNYDLCDPESGAMIMECREERLGTLTKLLRFTKYKGMTPFHIEIRTPDGQIVVQIKRGISIFLSKVSVLDENDQVIGGFKQKFFSTGNKFDVLDASDQIVCTLKGKLTSWNFKFAKGDVEFAHVSKNGPDLGKRLCSSADNYLLEIYEATPHDHPLRQLILAAMMCIDMVLVANLASWR